MAVYDKREWTLQPPNIPEEGYRYGHSLCSPIFMLTVNALISIEMKPESIAELEFLTG